MCRDTYKTITFAFVSHSVSDDHSFLDFTILIKVCFQSFVCCVVRKTTNKQFSEGGVFMCNSSHFVLKKNATQKQRKPK